MLAVASKGKGSYSVVLIRTSAETTKIAAGPLLYAGSVAWSSALLFVVQPIVAKSLLPRFGGSAGVWIACMLFFQVALLLGYLYSFCLTRYLSAKGQALVHFGLLTLSVGALPLKPRLEATGVSPTTAILFLLASSVGLPYFGLSATSPLLQSWLAASRGKHLPYRLFALSNAASLLALLAYPVAIEPVLSIRLQMAYWSGGYVALLFLLAIAVAGDLRQTRPTDSPQSIVSECRPWLWIALAGCASTLWLAIANYLGQQVAAMPFLWVLPMAVYLLSFILCFEADGWYRPALFRWLMPIAWIAICSRIALEGSAGGLQWEIPVFCTALFICCMFCHGELARNKPAPQHGLAFFYLMVASGGALGGVFVGLVAPNLFPTFLELPLGVTACVFLTFYFLFGIRSPRRLIRLGVVAALAFVVSTQYHAEHRVVRTRNFYGALQIREMGDGDSAVRALYSGRTIHGLELLSPALQRTPTTYYGVQSGAGLVLGKSLRPPNRSVAIVGLGAGTLATYGRSGDFFRFYEINPAVIRAAVESFDFLRDSAAATDVVRGDGRLMLDREPLHSFDIVVLDGFSDDAVPVHLLTRQAFEMYFDRLRPGGLLLIHLSNRYLDLGAEVEVLAAELRKDVLRIHSVPDRAQWTEPADWAIVAGNRDDLTVLRRYAQPPSQRRVRPWTDEYNSLFQIWK
jgi:SAM-dependent methyltransferase